jgi:hypothetical protein
MLAGLCNRRDELREAGSVEDDSKQIYNDCPPVAKQKGVDTWG